MRGELPAIGAAVVLALAASGPAEAGEEEKTAACVSAFDAAQLRRDELRLLDAREALRACARDECPEIVRRKCRDWLVEVEAQVPSLAVAVAEEDGRDVATARLSVDGVLAAERLGGAAIEIDPGPRRIRIEHPDGRAVEATVVVVQGEKNRVVRLRLPTLAGRAARPSPPRPLAVAERRSISPVAWGAFGVSAAALIVGSVAGGLAFARTADLEERCATAPGCDQGDIDAVKPLAHLSTAGFAVAGAGAAVGVVALALTWPTSASAPIGLTATIRLP